MTSSTITSKGQMTVPKAIRDRFHLDTGDRIDFVVEDERIVLVPATRTLAELARVLPSSKKPVSLKEMEQAIQTRRLQRSK